MYTVDEKSANANEEVTYGYLKRVLTFCFMTDFYQKTGLTLADLLTLDLATYEYLERKYVELKPVEQKAVDDIFKNFNLDTKARKNR